MRSDLLQLRWYFIAVNFALLIACSEQTEWDRRVVYLPL